MGQGQDKEKERSYDRGIVDAKRELAIAERGGDKNRILKAIIVLETLQLGRLKLQAEQDPRSEDIIECETLLRRGIDLATELYGPTSRWVGRQLCMLAEVHLFNARCVQAKEALEMAVVGLETEHQEFLLIEALTHLIILCVILGDEVEAERRFEQLVGATKAACQNAPDLDQTSKQYRAELFEIGRSLRAMAVMRGLPIDMRSDVIMDAGCPLSHPAPVSGLIPSGTRLH